MWDQADEWSSLRSWNHWTVSIYGWTKSECMRDVTHVINLNSEVHAEPCIHNLTLTRNNFRSRIFWSLFETSAHWSGDKMATNFLTTVSNAFSLMKIHKFRLIFQWSLFPRVQDSSIGSDNSVATTRLQAIIWTNDGQFTGAYIYASFGPRSWQI